MSFVLVYQGDVGPVLVAGPAQNGPRPGMYLAAYDPDFRPPPEVRSALGVPDDVVGAANWTEDPAEALHFATAAAAIAAWRVQSTVVPVRADGRPNRPLTAYTVSVEELVEDPHA